MTLDADETEIRRLVAAVLGIQLMPSMQVSRATEPKWDSLKHVQIMFTLEDAFSMRFTEDEMSCLADLAGLVAAVKKHRQGS